MITLYFVVNLTWVRDAEPDVRLVRPVQRDVLVLEDVVGVDVGLVDAEEVVEAVLRGERPRAARPHAHHVGAVLVLRGEEMYSYKLIILFVQNRNVYFQIIVRVDVDSVHV